MVQGVVILWKKVFSLATWELHGALNSTQCLVGVYMQCTECRHWVGIKCKSPVLRQIIEHMLQLEWATSPKRAWGRQQSFDS